MQQIVEGYELSPQQKELWRVMQGAVDDEFGVESEVCVAGPVDEARLERAIETVLARHEILRTGYERVAGLSYPLQVIGERVAGDVRVSWHDGVLTIKLGALNGDRQSLHNLVQEIAAAYGAPEETSASYLQYADASEIFNELVGSEGGREHWERVKAETVPALEFAFAKTATSGGGLDQVSFDLSDATQAKLLEFCRERQVTEQAVLLTAWAALLSRLSAQSRLRLYLISAGRRHEELVSAVGLFARRLPLALRVEGSFATALAAAGEQVELADKWQEYYEAARTETIDAGFEFEFYQWPRPVAAAGVRFEIRRVQVRQQRPQLRLSVGRDSERVRLELTYNEARFAKVDAERLSEEYETLLVSALAESDARLTELEIVGEREREQLLTVMHGPVCEQSREPVHEAFLRQVQRRPSTIAVVGEDEQLTYAELNKRANQLASYLIARGVAAEQVVGLSLERSVELVVALLGILKAGGAYLPLDPAYPAARLQQMVHDAGVKLIVSHSDQRKLLDEVADGASVIYLDEQRAEIAREPERDVKTRSGAENLAYVLYTSGSTGRPKGVMIEHGALSNHMEWIIRAAGLTEHDTVLQKTGISFDASVWEFWGALQTGGQLAVGGRGMMDGDELVSLVQQRQATVLQVVPAQLRLMIESSGFHECQSLRRVFSGGEPLRKELVDQYYTQQNAVLTNLYGPTETTIDATWKEVSERVTLGRAIDNVTVLVLGDGQRLKATGEAGEIYIGGAGLARGYFGRAAQTAEKFVPDAGAIGQRLYRTGDLGRIVAGELEYIGRVDEQVKVRGYRIELGEIEAELNRQPEVKAAAVVLQREEQRLVAYVELRETVTAAELRRRLQDRLPEWMVPGVYERVAVLPLSANGKVDRKRLQTASSERLTTGGEYEQAHSGVEAVLAGIWSEVLKLDRIGIHDNFFELGGDSILSIKVIARANRAGLKLTPRQLFQNQTIAKLASVATAGTVVKGEQGIVSGNVPSTPVQRRFFETNLLDLHHYNQSVLFETRDKLHDDLLRRAVAALIVHHDALRLRFHDDGATWQQTNAATEHDCFTRIDLSAVAGQDRSLLLERAAGDLQTSLDLTNGPLIRAALFTWPNGMPDRFMMVIHHLAVDGVSWRILLDDLQRAYGQLKVSEPVDLGPKTTSFQQWAEKMVEYAQSPKLRSEVPFWRDMLEPNAIPVDHPDGRNDRSSAERFSLSLDQEHTRALLQDSPKKYRAQINDLLLTALLEAFHRSTGVDSIAVNLEGHGREDLFEDVDLTRTVGWFTTIFPVRCSKVNGESVVSTLKRIKEVSRSLPNNGLGYGVLKYLTETDLTQLREPQVSLNYLGQLDAAVPEELGFTAAGESMGPMQSERGARSNLLDFSAAVLGEKLWIGCTYSTNLYERETIEKLTTAFLEALRSLASLRADSPAKAYTPSDFALAQLHERSLTRLISLYPNLEDAYPLSHMQQGMLFHNLYAPDSTTYFLQLGCTFNGSLDIEAFTKAWQGVIARHPILRTAFAWEGLEQPLQIVCAGAEFMLDQANWCDRTPAEQEVEFERLLKQDRIKGFDLTKAPLMRFRLIRTADDCYYFVWNRHHLLMDGWSVPLILKEVFALYAANLKGVDVELEPVRPFRDYIAWLNEQDMQATETFWRDRLSGFTAPTAVGNNAQSGLEESFGELRRQLSAETTQELQAYVRRRQITLNTMLLGVWGIVLSRLGNAGDVVFGTAVSGRPPSLPGVESIVGVFINMLPLRVVLSNESPVTDWLRQLQQQQIEMQQHEFTPLVQIQNWSDVPRGLPLFESVLIFENYPMEEVLAPRKGSLGISNLRSFDRNNYPLNWLIMPGTELLLRLIYNEAHFDSGFMAKTIEQFETVLHLLVKHSELTLGEFLSLVDDNFRQQEARRAGTLEDVGRAKLKNITRRAAQLGI